MGSNVEVSATEPSNSGVDVWLNPSGSTDTSDLQSQIAVLNEKLNILQNIEVKTCTLADGVTGEITAYRFGGNIVYIVGLAIFSSISTGIWNPICTIPFPPKYTNRTTDFSIKPNKANTSTAGYIITLNANGGYVSTPELTQYNTTSYTFRSWNTNSSGTGTTYNSGGSYTANADVTLYAIWNTNTTKGSVTLPTPARTHYSFVGWGTTASATTGVTGTITPTSSQTLYAVWERTPSLINWRDSSGNFTSGGTISVKDSNGKWVVINKIKLKNSSGVWEEH